MIGKPNPRGKKIDKQGGTGPRFGSPLAYVLLVLVAFLLLRTLFQDAGFQRVPYSRLLDRIQSDGCAKVVLSQDWVKCYPKGAEGSGDRSFSRAEGALPMEVGRNLIGPGSGWQRGAAAG